MIACDGAEVVSNPGATARLLRETTPLGGAPPRPPLSDAPIGGPGSRGAPPRRRLAASAAARALAKGAMRRGKQRNDRTLNPRRLVMLTRKVRHLSRIQFGTDSATNE